MPRPRAAAHADTQRQAAAAFQLVAAAGAVAGVEVAAPGVAAGCAAGFGGTVDGGGAPLAAVGVVDHLVGLVRLLCLEMRGGEVRGDVGGEVVEVCAGDGRGEGGEGDVEGEGVGRRVMATATATATSTSAVASSAEGGVVREGGSGEGTLVHAWLMRVALF
jgi:hypothetical protein